MFRNHEYTDVSLYETVMNKEKDTWGNKELCLHLHEEQHTF